jgi:hypothetical protein
MRLVMVDCSARVWTRYGYVGHVCVYGAFRGGFICLQSLCRFSLSSRFVLNATTHTRAHQPVCECKVLHVRGGRDKLAAQVCEASGAVHVHNFFTVYGFRTILPPTFSFTSLSRPVLTIHT